MPSHYREQLQQWRVVSGDIRRRGRNKRTALCRVVPYQPLLSCGTNREYRLHFCTSSRQRATGGHVFVADSDSGRQHVPGRIHTPIPAQVFGRGQNPVCLSATLRFPASQDVPDDLHLDDGVGDNRKVHLCVQAATGT